YLSHASLILRATRQGTQNGRAIASSLEAPVKEYDGVALPGAPDKSAKRLAQAERGMRHNELGLGIAPGLGPHRKQGIAQRREGDARHDNTGWRQLGLFATLPESSGSKQHHARLSAEGLPELAGRAVLSLREHKDVLPLQGAANAKSQGT